MLEVLTFSISLLCLILIVVLIIIMKKIQYAKNKINGEEYIIVNSNKDQSHKLGIKYFVDEKNKAWIFGKKHIIIYKAQLLLDSFPIGTSWEISKSEVSEVDKEEVNKVLFEFAKPLIEKGIEVYYGTVDKIANSIIKTGKIKQQNQK